MAEKKSTQERLAEHTDTSDPNGCWLWGGRLDRDGYGRSNKQMAHRAVYADLVGPIPAGMELDHLCETRSCVNPAHLEVVTRGENNRRMNAAVLRRMDGRPRATKPRPSHCYRGHELTDENTYTYIPKSGRSSWTCRPCNRAAAARLKARKIARTTPTEDTRDGE